MPSKPHLTHFLCIPLLTPSSKPQLQRSLTHFKTQVTISSPPYLPNGIPTAAIRPLGTLHLTLGVMSLPTPERVQRALDVLNGLDLKGLLADIKSANIAPKDSKLVAGTKTGEDQAEDDNIYMTLQGLHPMLGQSSSAATVLYAAPLDPDLRLYRFGQAVRAIFFKEDLLEERDRELLLHATIVNTGYLPSQGKGKGKGKKKEKVTLDVRGLVDEWEDFVWMQDVRVEEVRICRMGALMVEGEEEGEEYVVEGGKEMP